MENKQIKWVNHLLTTRRLSERTVQEYEKDLNNFRKWMSQYKTKVEDEWISSTMIQGYINELTKRGTQASTIKRIVCSLRSYFTYLVKQGKRPQDPTKGIDTPVLRNKLTEIADINKLRDYLSKPAAHKEDYLLQAITSLLTTTGLRISEALSITREDINKEDRSIKIHGKGQRERYVYYDETTRKKLNAWVKVRNDGEIFQGWTDRDIRDLMKAKLPKSERAIHPHTLRHTFATEVYNKGCDLETLKAMLGHAQSKTTERYVHVAKERAQSEWEKYRVQL